MVTLLYRLSECVLGQALAFRIGLWYNTLNKEQKRMLMKNQRYITKNLLTSVKYAAAGIKAAFGSEKNFLTYTFIAAAFLLFNVITGSGKYDYALLAVCTAAVFSAELINTALERVCDSRTHDESSDIEFIKNVSAGAVLAAGAAFFICEGIVLISNIAGR